MNAVFKAQVDYTKQKKEPHWYEVSNSEQGFDWDDKEAIKKAVLSQNKLINEGNFDPVDYFGGYKPEDVGTGIVRKIMVHMFAPEPKKRSIRPFPDHNQTITKESQNMIPKVRKPKASHSQAELDPSKCPSLAEISSSLHTSQSRINQLMNNLKSMKCAGNSSSQAKVNKNQNNSYLKYWNPSNVRLH